MKLLFNILFVFIFHNVFLAQTGINVVITGECDVASGNYSYIGLLNGKNNYLFTFDTVIQTETVKIGFDNSNWILYKNNDLRDIGFINVTVLAGSLPPFTGWVAVECPSGTLNISENLAINQYTNVDICIDIFSNPTSDYLTIKCASSANESFTFQIADSSGRINKKGKQLFGEKIDVSKLSSGQYLIEIQNKELGKIIKKLIKI